MRWLTASIAWIYDFLAEDLTLLVGTVAAVVVAALVAHSSARAAGYVLWVLVMLVIVASIWRTAKS